MKNYNLNTLTSIGVHYQRQSVFSILSHCSDTYQRAQNHKTLGPSTSQAKSAIASIFILILAILTGGLFFSHSAYAGTSISVANTGNTISFGNVKPSSSGSVVTASDELTITTDCSAGSNVYISAVDGSSYGTNLINNAAASNNEISTLSGTTIGTTATTLSNNTWGFNTTNNNTYYGLPAYANATDHAIYSGTNTTVPIYYGAKVTNSLAPGKYIGQVLYTATVNTSCLFYTVTFNKNAEDATGTMADQTITPATSTPLTSNGFSRPGYIFLGWSTDSSATTPTYTDGQSVTDLTQGGGTITLYAIWGQTMQSWAGNFGCSTLSENQTITLLDARDNSEYSIKKFSDGSCWMISNLKLGYDKAYTLTKDLTNITDNGSYYLPQAGYQASLNGTNVATVNFSSSSDNQARVQYASASDLLVQSSPLANAQDTGYYNFYAATLGKSYSDLNGNVSGYVERDICPKGWQLPVNDSSNHRSWYYFYNTLNGGQHANLVSASGASLLYSGEYYYSSLRSVGYHGLWWSSTVYDTYNSRHLRVTSDGHVYPQDYNYGGKYYGFAVRCVAKTGYMQDFNCNNLASGGTAVLADKRDNQEYSVYRIPDSSAATNIRGKCFMTKDLNLGAVAFASTASSTMNTANTNMTLSPLDSNFTSPTGSGESITVPTSDVTVNMTWNNSNRYSNRHYHTNGTGNYAGRGYYSWGAAMVVCPKGWRLPTSDELNNSSSWNASTSGISQAAGNSLSTITASPYSFVLGGRYYDGFYNAGSSGYYWSSTQYNSLNAYYLSLHSSDGLARGNDSKCPGFAVRCIAE